MSDRDVTTVEVKRETWQTLNMRREPGDSMDDVIQRALNGENQDPSQDDGEGGRERSDGPEDIVKWVREHQPATRQEIVQAFSEEWEKRNIQADSWWRRHAKQELEAVGAEYTRNVGWQFK
jgi:hypothetical protein